MTLQIKTIHGLTMQLYKVHNLSDMGDIYYLKSKPDEDIHISVEGDHVAICDSFTVNKSSIYSIDLLHA